MPPKGKKKAEAPSEEAPPARRSARVAAAPPTEAPPKPERKTTARSVPKGKKKTEDSSEGPAVPIGEALGAVQAEAEAAPAEFQAAAAPTKADVLALLLPRFQEANPTMDEDELRGVLEVAIDGYEVQNFEAMMLLEDVQETILANAQAMIPSAEDEAPEPPGSAAAAAAAAAPPASPATSVDDLLVAAKAAQKKRAPPPAAVVDDDDGEEEDSPVPTATPSTIADILTVKLPVSETAKAYEITVKARSPDASAVSSQVSSEGAVPMEASQASASQAESMDEEAATVPGKFDSKDVSVRVTPVTNAMFSERAGELYNEVFPAHGMAPVPWSMLKAAHAQRSETYYAVTLAQQAPGSVLGKDYDLATGGDPKKVAVAGVINIYWLSPTKLVVKILDLGTRADLVPKAGGVNPWLAHTLKEVASWVATRVPTIDPRSILLRYQRKQLATDNEFVSSRNTLASVGVAISQYTHSNPGALPVLLKKKGAGASLPITNQVLNLTVEGPDRVTYESRAKGSGAVTMVATSEIDRVRALDPEHGEEDAPSIEFVAPLAALLDRLPPIPGAAPAQAFLTVSKADVLEDSQYIPPRRGGRRVTSRQSSSPKRTGPSSGRPRGYTRRRRA